MSVPAATPATTDTAKTHTEYVVLRFHEQAANSAGGLTGWHMVKTVDAANGDAAIKKAADDTPGKYVAVPTRSWVTRTVTVETKKTVSLS